MPKVDERLKSLSEVATTSLHFIYNNPSSAYRPSSRRKIVKIRNNRKQEARQTNRQFKQYSNLNLKLPNDDNEIEKETKTRG